MLAFSHRTVKRLDLVFTVVMVRKACLDPSKSTCLTAGTWLSYIDHSEGSTSRGLCFEFVGRGATAMRASYLKSLQGFECFLVLVLRFGGAATQCLVDGPNPRYKATERGDVAELLPTWV